MNNETSKEILVFATQNQHKAEEIQKVFSGSGLDHFFELKGLWDYGFEGEIPEEEMTLEGNASSKSGYIKNHLGVNCFADDTGLEVEALDGRPGVYSARYAGEEGNAEKNMARLLQELENQTNRKARFRTVISLILHEKEYLFEGMVSGTILKEKSGDHGFGYDPLFQPDGYNISFAEMRMEEKVKISHRSRAFAAMIDFLKDYRKE